LQKPILGARVEPQFIDECVSQREYDQQQYTWKEGLKLSLPQLPEESDSLHSKDFWVEDCRTTNILPDTSTGRAVGQIFDIENAGGDVEAT
jgi:hypothetical protein